MGKILLDHNVPKHILDRINATNAHKAIRLDELYSNGALLPDIEVLRRAKDKHYYVITMDRDFEDPRQMPCNQTIFANRTLLRVQKTALWRSYDKIKEAWDLFGWRVVKDRPLLVVTEVDATIYRCDKGVFVQVEKKSLKIVRY